MIKLLATDLDNTLLDGTKGITKKNQAALTALAKKGVIIVIATGRARSTIPPMVEEFVNMDYLITSNGAKTWNYKTGELMFEYSLSASAVEMVKKYLSLEDVMLEVFVDSVPYLTKRDKQRLGEFGVPSAYIPYFQDSRQAVDDLGEILEKKGNSIENINLMFKNPELRIKVLEDLRSEAARTDDFVVTSSFHFNIEIGGKDVHKGMAISRLCDVLGIDSSETICLGDNFNDIEMLKFANISVAMKSSPQEVKDIATYVVEGRDETGVAEAINKLIK
jgi:Cof subfamily protein (haloacid dehalogenase superfamily)